MTLPVSGAISFNAINVELGVAGTTTANINQASYRTLAGVPGSGTTISLSNFYGKSNRVSVSSTFSSSTANASLNISAIGGYVAGVTDITVTINGGIYLYATSTGNYGLTLTGGTAGDTLTIVNNGFIMGMGGIGGNTAVGGGVGGVGAPGGPALNIGTGIGATINNTNGSAYIGGGGGGGGGGNGGGGGGAGGADGGTGNGGTGAGAGGGIGASGSNGGSSNGGGGGGRVFPGVGGAAVTVAATVRAPGLGGTGGGSGGAGPAIKGGGVSGAGGSSNGVGGNGNGSSGGGGGGWGASGGSGTNGIGGNAAGGAGGKAVNLNGNSVTWTSGNTTRVYGAVS